MGTTFQGIVFPDPTDPPRRQDLEDLAVSVDGLVPAGDEDDLVALDDEGRLKTVDSDAYAPRSAIAAADLGRVVAYDTFDRADGDLNGQTSDSGHTWTVLNGNWVTDDNRARYSSGGSGRRIAALDVGTNRQDVEATLVVGGVSLAACVIDAANWIEAVVLLSSVNLELNVDGTTTLAASVSLGNSVGDTSRIRLSVRGDVVEIFRNGERIIRQSLPSSDADLFAGGESVGLVAFALSGNASPFDDLVVRRS